MKEIKKISVQELDILAQEAASLKGGQTVKPFINDVQTNKHSIVAPAPYKGTRGTRFFLYLKGIRMVKQNDKNSLGHFAY